MVKGAAGLFAACLTLHLALWRIPQARRIPVLFAVFFVPPLAVILVAVSGPGPLAPGLRYALGVVLGHAALSCAYIQSYPAMVPAAPTLRILLLVAARESEGASVEQLRRGLGTQGLMAEAIDPLVAGGLLRRQEDTERLEITSRGRVLLRPFSLLRGIIGLPPGAG